MPLVLDSEICKTADGDTSNDLRGLIRVGRRAIKRCWLDRETILRRRVFCQNSGACGSTYIVQLLQENGIERCFHEKAPDFYDIGLDYFDNAPQSHSQSRIVRLLRYTRHDVDFEANNRMFSLSQELAAAFPNIAFIHLHRDGTEAVRSAMSKPNVENYLAQERRFKGRLAGDQQLQPFERFCHHWANMNLRIADDIDAVVKKQNGEFAKIRFEELVSGEVSELENILKIKLKQPACKPVNVGPVKSTGKFPPYADWTIEQKATFGRICGSTMSRLGR